ncbi:alpha carbonic anhydrase [Biscogniauxia marginata]|nr:alpha carbonic anhydrase [Biscogniauxia marginata]
MAFVANILLLAASVTPALAFCGAHTHLDKREEGVVPISTFSGTGLTGPLLWDQLDAANAVCATGTTQSPIDMVPEVFTLVEGSNVTLDFAEVPGGAEFENLGSTVEVVMEEHGSSLLLDGLNYTLQQFHFHNPSEHLDNGTKLPMEMHMVFMHEEAEVAVLAVYVDIADPMTLGAPTALLETVFSSVHEISTPGTLTTTLPLSLASLQTQLQSGSFQRYTGSLTTPPCTEGVSWLVSTEKLAITRETYLAVREVVGFNARYVQNTPGEQNLLQVFKSPSALTAQNGTSSNVTLQAAAHKHKL